jgi:hypothetical protein
MFSNFKEFLMAWYSSLFSHDTVKVHPEDPVRHFLLWKLKEGDNVSFDMETDPDTGDYIVISATKQTPRNVERINSDTEIGANTYLVLVDASQNQVTVELPPTHDTLGQLSIVAVDPTHGINIVPNHTTTDTLFDTTNVNFVHAGDAVTFSSDRAMNGVWYCVGTYHTNFYA